MPFNDSLQDDPHDQCDADLAEAEANATFWKYRYLNQFLALRTQNVLTWLRAAGAIRLPRIHELLSATGADLPERTNILDALATNGLAVEEGGLLVITTDGQRYTALPSRLAHVWAMQAS